jgi:predicted nucleic acid-binding protein
LFFTFQNIAELWNVAPRPLHRNGFGLTPEEVEEDVESIEALLSLLPDGAVTYSEWRGIVSNLQVSGVQVHDARLAAAMVVHDLTHLLTFNKADFARYTGITALDPSDVLAQYPSSS